MVTRNVVLTDHQEDMIDTLVGSGRYQNASEVLREGLRLIERREAEDAAKLVALRKAVAAGEADIAAGRYRDFESFEALKIYLKKLRTSAAARRASRK